MQSPREFLKQEYVRRRAQNPNFSLRSFAKWLKISPSQLSQMLSGKRKITLKILKKMSGKLSLSPIEKKQLLSLTYEGLDFLEEPVANKYLQLKEDQFRLIADWYHLAILSLTKVKGAKSDVRWISRRLGISMEDAEQALCRLQRLGILQLKPEFKQIGNAFEVSSNISSEAIRKYHKQNLNLAAEKLESVGVSYREFQSISLSMNPDKVQEIKPLIDEFLDSISSSFESPQGAEVYNMNVQLFPVTLIKDNKT